MKKAMCIAAAAILILSLAGCAETAGPAPSESNATPVVNGETSQESTAARETAAHSFSDSKEMPSAPETEKATEEPAEESKPDPDASTEVPTEAEKPQETPVTPSKAAETPQPEKPESRSVEPAEPKPSEPPRETQPPAAPEPETTPEPTPDQPPAKTQPPIQTEPPAVEEPVELDRLRAELCRERGTESGQHCHRLLGQPHRGRRALCLPGTGHSEPSEPLCKGRQYSGCVDLGGKLVGRQLRPVYRLCVKHHISHGRTH